ncbi:MAG: hypothetical protein LBQ68_08250 [Clostridiales bacterium]|jgi:hypothetical protein|nr:hypothetical protein [Clostridiales bacterium]
MSSTNFELFSTAKGFSATFPRIVRKLLDKYEIEDDLNIVHCFLPWEFVLLACQAGLT